MAELYPVNETFLSWQGEGVHLGRKSFFIRLQGCPVKCTWCDSASTWHPQFVPKQVRKASAGELADEAAAARPEFVVLTGGEPCIHDLTALLAAMASVGLKVHLETCGAYPIAQGFAWVTVSPKWAKPPLADALARADEIKLMSRPQIASAAGLRPWAASGLALTSGYTRNGRAGPIRPYCGRLPSR
jgi:organic radical activating enzyme